MLIVALATALTLAMLIVALATALTLAMLIVALATAPTLATLLCQIAREQAAQDATEDEAGRAEAARGQGRRAV